MLTTLIHRWLDRDAAVLGVAAAPQVGVAPYAMEGDVPVFLLVTTRRTGRWIFPKGVCKTGEAPTACAAREALEEAGIEGEVARQPVGAYRDRKYAARTPVIEVEVYPMRVTRQHDDWPEKRARKRHWATLEEARNLITTPGLIELAERTAVLARASAAGQQH